ncbi:MAG: VWA domain-containing protein [Deltaproteobacteria bacterium]|nr:VWA domain-containing protein [Deltaproteobacteria bacterium]
MESMGLRIDAVGAVKAVRPGRRFVVTALLALAALTACRATHDPAGPGEGTSATVQSTPESPTLPAQKAGTTADPFRGTEEVIVTGSNEGSLLSPGSTAAVAFDAVALDAVDSGIGGPLHARRAAPGYGAWPAEESNLDRYDAFSETGFVTVRDRPLSTFSIDVDTASYSNLRRFLQEGTKPPRGAVRIEEMLNYFRYPTDSPELETSEARPIAVETELFEAPWEPDHRLVRVAIAGRAMPAGELPPRNLVLLVDVSGSMEGPDRLPWVKRGLVELVEHLRARDRVAIVVYAGASGLVLEPTPGNRRDEILAALDRLSAGGSTAGAEGIQLAYHVARRHFDPKGINRVILATDGDFNVGVTSRSELVDLIEKERESGVFLSVLGFGRGNLNDAGMEELADHGNGNYAYVDSPAEARRVLVHEAGSTLVTIARDVKIQAEFNPARVQAYRLIGYENRRLADRDFNDDRKDAGEVGAGHQLTALYEIVPVGVPYESGVDPLKYGGAAASRAAEETKVGRDEEWMTVKLRYQPPQGGRSRKLERAVRGTGRPIAEASESARFTAAVALFGMLLQESEHTGSGDFALVRRLAREALGADERGERAEFVRLVSLAEELRS